MRFSNVPLTRKRLRRWTSRGLSEYYLCSGLLMGMTGYISVSTMRRVKKKKEREKKKKKAFLINQLVRQEDLLYNELPLRCTKRIGNSFTKED